MTLIGLATVLPGALSFNEGNVSDTWRGQVLLEDGSVRGAIFKDLEARELANELLGAVLADLSGLPTPPAYLGIVREQILPVSKGPALSDGSRLVFVSVDVKVPNVTFQARSIGAGGASGLLAAVASWVALGKLYGFDAWIANVDRHPGNLLFGGPEDVWLIDHGYSFSGPRWSTGDLVPDGDYPNRLQEWITPNLGTDQKRRRSGEAAEFATAISPERVHDAIEDSRVSALLPKPDLDAVRMFLAERRPHVPRAANRALGMPTLV